MDGNKGSSRKGKGIEFEEENILAIVNASGAKHTNDANEDRIAFLRAVRAISILSKNGTPPTGKILQEVFRILRIGKTLELIMASHQLLEESDKSFPRVLLSCNDTVPELVVIKKDWTPILVSAELNAGHREAGNDKDGALDSYGFQLLIQELVESVDEMNIQKCDIESVRSLLLFQHLADVLENDFVPRNTAYEGTTEWNFLKESLLNMLLGSRRLNYKSLVKECLTVMCRLYEISASLSDDDMMNQESGLVKSADDSAALIALAEVRRNACIALQKFITMVMKLDESKKKADLEGFTTRSDGIRTPMLELIVDELTYDSDTLHLFLQVYEEPKWKLEIVVQYLWKYIAKPSVRTRRSNGPADDDVTFRGALKCLSNITSTRSTVKKIGAEELQLLLGHGFQACLSLPSQLSDASKESTSYSLVELCRDVISAFKSLREAEKKMEILPFGKETLFTAATIISIKS